MDGGRTDGRMGGGGTAWSVVPDSGTGQRPAFSSDEIDEQVKGQTFLPSNER